MQTFYDSMRFRCQVCSQDGQMRFQQHKDGWFYWRPALRLSETFSSFIFSSFFQNDAGIGLIHLFSFCRQIHPKNRSAHRPGSASWTSQQVAEARGCWWASKAIANKNEKTYKHGRTRQTGRILLAARYFSCLRRYNLGRFDAHVQRVLSPDRERDLEIRDLIFLKSFWPLYAPAKRNHVVISVKGRSLQSCVLWKASFQVLIIHVSSNWWWSQQWYWIIGAERFGYPSFLMISCALGVRNWWWHTRCCWIS